MSLISRTFPASPVMVRLKLRIELKFGGCPEAMAENGIVKSTLLRGLDARAGPKVSSSVVSKSPQAELNKLLVAVR